MLVLPPEITHSQARACVLAVRQDMIVAPGSQWVLDASQLVRFDSSALAVLLQCRREALALGKDLTVHGLTPHLTKLAALYGIEDLLKAA
ncbi:MAG: STAS domain-containing protein [Burkholderiaceae bacterium]